MVKKLSGGVYIVGGDKESSVVTFSSDRGSSTSARGSKDKILFISDSKTLRKYLGTGKSRRAFLSLLQVSDDSLDFNILLFNRQALLQVTIFFLVLTGNRMLVFNEPRLVGISVERENFEMGVLHGSCDFVEWVAVEKRNILFELLTSFATGTVVEKDTEFA